MTDEGGTGMEGGAIVLASWLGTAAFAVTALAAMAAGPGYPEQRPYYPAMVVALVLFVASLPLSLYALAKGAVRTAQNAERVTVGGLFFLSRSAPPVVRRSLLGSLAVCLVVTAATASAEPFGVLVPVWPLALCGVWAARHGRFPPIPEPSR
ncbi:MAG: hypothetical protein M3357_13255 [Actinomycetota bacterium]|nr:hypothetical protein [Actinomycetota bacterium]